MRPTKSAPVQAREAGTLPRSAPPVPLAGMPVRPSATALLRPRRRKPWYARNRIMIPLTLLLSFLTGLAILLWNIPIVNELTGTSNTLGRQFVDAFKQKHSLVEAFNGSHQIRVIFVGLDHVPERGVEDPPHRSDSIMVAAVDFDTKQVRVVSVPRDSWVEHYLDGNNLGYDKLAHSYTKGGINQTTDTVQNLLGIQPIDYYVVIRFEGLAKVVDALGGLDVDVDHDMNYDDNHGNLHIHLKKGLQHLNGKEVVGFARFRHDTFGDITRMGRQQQVIKLMIEKIQRPENMMRLPYFAKTLSECVEKNFTLDQLMALAENAKDFPSANVQTMTLNSYGNQDPNFKIVLPGCPRGMAAQGIMPEDIDVARAFLENLEPPPPPPVEGESGATSDTGTPSGGTVHGWN